MKKTIVLLAVLFLIFGCTQPKEKDEINAIKEMRLPEGWTLKAARTSDQLEDFEQDLNIFATIEFENKEVLCKDSAMMGGTIGEAHPARLEAVIYKKEDLNRVLAYAGMSVRLIPILGTKNYAIELYYGYTSCSKESGEFELAEKIEKALEPFEAKEMAPLLPKPGE